ncbi:MAG: hypothetical protein WB489_12515, partial [Pseudolabrys sp.]
MLGALFGRFLVMREIARSIHQREMREGLWEISVPQIPSASARTSTAPSLAGGAGNSSNLIEFDSPGTTVAASVAPQLVSNNAPFRPPVPRWLPDKYASRRLRREWRHTRPGEKHARRNGIRFRRHI